MQIKVLDAYPPKYGVFVALEFPIGTSPKHGMELTNGMSRFLIKGINVTGPASELDAPKTRWLCLLAVNDGSVEVGDMLGLIYQ